MFCIFIFLTQKNTKPEQKDGSITLEQSYSSVESFYLKGNVVSSDHFHANCSEVDYGKHIEEIKL